MVGGHFRRRLLAQHRPLTRQKPIRIKLRIGVYQF